MKFPNLHKVWTEGKNLSLPDLLSCSLTTTTQDEHRLRTVEIPETIKFFMAHNTNTQLIQCHYAVSKEYLNSISTDNITEATHFPISLQIKEKFFKVQLKNNLYLPVSYHEFHTKAKPVEYTETEFNGLKTIPPPPPKKYPIIQHTDVTLNTNKTEPYTQNYQGPNYAEIINTIKFSLSAMDNFIPKSPGIYNFFYDEHTEISDKLVNETQQQDPVIRPLLLWKPYKNVPHTPSLTIRANKGLLHYHRRFQHLSINESNNLLYYVQETQPPKTCLPLSLILTVFYAAHSHDLSGHPGREKTHATITETYYFPNITTWIAILTQDCLNCKRANPCQTS